MESRLSSARQKKIDEAIRAAIGRRAVEGLVGQRIGSKGYTDYQQYMLSDGSKAYVNLDTLKVSVSDPDKTALKEFHKKELARAERAARPETSKRGRSQPMAQTTATAGSGNGRLSLAETVSQISKAVASAVLAEAQVIPKPTTRTELFEKIEHGVEEGVKRIGFHG